jgi:hypothetical protein
MNTVAQITRSLNRAEPVDASHVGDTTGSTAGIDDSDTTERNRNAEVPMPHLRRPHNPTTILSIVSNNKAT